MREQPCEHEVRDQLPYDSGDHRIRPRCKIAIRFGTGCRSQSPTDRLQEQGEEINGAKDPKVLLSAQGTRVRAKDMDDIAKDDVDATGEECGAEYERGDLDLECQSAVGTLRGPGSSDPAEEFA